MATNFPTSLDALTNPTSTDSVATVDHAAQHANANDSIEALEAKVGINSSAVTTSHDYKLGEVTGSDKAVGKTATQTLTNKTLTAPVISTISNTGTLTLPTSTDTLTGRATTDTLTNKTLTSPVINGSLSGTAILDEDNMASNSDTKVPTQQSVKAYVDAATGSYSAKTLIAHSVLDSGSGDPSASLQLNSNTTAYLGQIVVPFGMTINKITIKSAGSIGTAGTLDLSLYSETGQTQYFSVTTASVAAADTLYTTAVSSVGVTAGIYYLMVNTNGTADVTVQMWQVDGDGVFGTTAGFIGDVTSEPKIQGSLTITAGTPPATFDPTAITENISGTIASRWDN